METIAGVATSIILKQYSFDTFVSVVKKIHDVLDVIFSSEHNDVKKKVANLDISSKLKEIHALMNDIEKTKLCHDKESIATIMVSLHDIVEQVQENLNQIANKMIDHKQKYLNAWRNLDHTNEINELEILDQIMDNRYTRLKDLLKINWNNFS
ncbi:MAG: hypothetical protein Edafosvirus2_11 [Edafosvirus sp.]|uniref:Uncharacterized protein n=1 Tax=Edafosvirus sp. TaxID=2487765 RepID=A0A3G4ZSE4_9VIRU|nr:MAG: hypothetical protein Edafosvirus2_11 [Edafosvirus sp.]